MDRIEALISELTLEEKVSVLSGSTAWHTTAVPRLNLPRIKMTDGPIGARGDSVSGATSACFPSASCLSSSWDKETVEDIAKAIEKVYNMSPEERKERGMAGREFACSDEARFTAEGMCKSMIENIEEGINTFTPRSKFDLIKIEDRESDFVKHKTYGY